METATAKELANSRFGEFMMIFLLMVGFLASGLVGYELAKAEIAKELLELSRDFPVSNGCGCKTQGDTLVPYLPPPGDRSILKKDSPLIYVWSKEGDILVNAKADIASEVLKKVKQYRQEIADEWLGGKVPLTPSIIHVIDTEIGDDGVTSLIPGHVIGSSSGGKREHHLIWIRSTDPLGPTLKHEVTHITLASVGKLPKWLHEGIASRYDGGTVPYYSKEYREAMERVEEELKTLSKEQLIYEYLERESVK